MARHAHRLLLRNLTKRYGAKTVVDNLSLEVGAGKFLTLLGPSGSGKTSILMMIAGFIDPSEGEILLDDQNITAVPPERRDFGLVFQGYALFPHLTVGGNVGFPLAIRRHPHSERASKVRAALEQVQLAELGKRMPRELSGGQQQRVALARALVFSPNILLLDEPLSALDKKLRTDLQVELRQLHRDVGMTFICVTHDQEEALTMSDEVAILRDGRLIQVGGPRELYERPATHFVANFLGESNFIEGEVTGRTSDSVIFRAAGLDFRQVLRGEQCGIGEPIMVAVRPSAIQLSDRWGDNSNCVAGVIIDLTYRGDRIAATIRTVVGLLRAEDLSGRLGSLVLDQKIWLSWTPDAPVIVRDDRLSSHRTRSTLCTVTSG
jgi:putative spermidine/putrescine transport system ATP-binding protein